MKSVEEIFVALGGTGAVARLLEVGHSTASEMRRRGSIPVRYWPRLVAVAVEREIEGISNDSLVGIHTSAAA
jgi:hypothetical protein